MRLAVDETKNYQVYINSKLVANVDTEEEVWDVVGDSFIGDCYEVGSATGKDVSGFTPF